MPVPIEIEQIYKAHQALEDKYDPKLCYNYKRNTLPIESRFYISLEGLHPDQSILREWLGATRSLVSWTKALNPDYVLLTGRSSEVTVRSLDAVSCEGDDNLPILILGSQENHLLYKDTTDSLITDEDFFEGYMARGYEYTLSFENRRKFLLDKFASDGSLPKHIVVLDELVRNGHKARFIKEFLGEQGITVDFGAIVGPIETSLAKLGSTDPNLFAFMENLIKALVGIRNRQSLGKRGIGEEADQQALELADMIGNIFARLKE